MPVSGLFETCNFLHDPLHTAHDGVDLSWFQVLSDTRIFLDVVITPLDESLPSSMCSVTAAGFGGMLGSRALRY